MCDPNHNVNRYIEYVSSSFWNHNHPPKGVCDPTLGHADPKHPLSMTPSTGGGCHEAETELKLAMVCTGEILINAVVFAVFSSAVNVETNLRCKFIDLCEVNVGLNILDANNVVKCS